MNFDVSWAILAVVLVAIVGLFFAVKSFKMPPTFNKNQEKRAEIRKKIKDPPLS